jgi:type IV pilus secretin PilQ/predicted competence protein
MDFNTRQLAGTAWFGKGTACVFLIALVLHLVGGPGMAADTVSDWKSILETMRAGRHDNYTSVVFQFGGPFSFDMPTRSGNEIQFKIRNVKTQLIPYREYRISKAWIRLEPLGDDIDIRVGLLGAFADHRFYTLKNPDRLVINLFWPEQSTDAAEPDKDPDAKKLPQTPSADPISNLIETESQDTAMVAAAASQAEKTSDVPPAPAVDPVMAPPEPVNPEVAPDVKPEEILDASPVSPEEPLTNPTEHVDPVEEEPLLSLNFFQSDIQEVLTALAIQQNLNIVTAKDVMGNVTVHLNKVSFHKALGAICQSGGFGFYKRNDVYYVYKPKKEAEQGYEDLRMEIFKLEYADMDKIQEVLEAIPHIRLIKIHEPTKTIIVEDTPENIEKIDKLIRYWDVKPKQVMIEAKILEITLTDDMSWGVDWEQMLGNDITIGTGGFSTARPPDDSPVPLVGRGIFANMVTGSGTNYQFSAALDALQARTEINTLSTPKLLAIHGKSAKVLVGGQQGYDVTTVSDGISQTSVEFIDTGTILDITPYIDKNNNVLLKVEPSINSARIEEDGIPVVNSTAVTTWLLAEDGETVFIGGLIQNTENSTQTGIPCLGDMPVLGFLFGRTVLDAGKSELIVLITPYVMPENTPGNFEAVDRTKEAENQLQWEKRQKFPLFTD